jgi:hypothetical protein
MRAQKTRETLLIKEGTLFLSRPCIFSTNFYHTYLRNNWDINEFSPKSAFVKNSNARMGYPVINFYIDRQFMGKHCLQSVKKSRWALIEKIYQVKTQWLGIPAIEVYNSEKPLKKWTLSSKCIRQFLYFLCK